MKRIISLILCAVLALGIFAGCDQTGGNGETGGSDALQGFSVGYGKADISPESSVYLFGYGDAKEDRMSTGVAEHLYATTVAFTDTKGNTMLLISTDLLLVSKSVAEHIRKNVSNETGVPVENIMFHCSHNHSGPDPSDATYNVLLTQRVTQSCVDAMADRKPAKMETTFSRPEGYNYVRHYLLADGTFQGEGVGAVPKSDLIGHYGKADNLLQLVKFTREGGKDIVMMNWQGHPRGSDPAPYTVATCNFAGIMRQTVEEGLDCNGVFILSGSGNVNNNSQIAREVFYENYIELGKALGQEVIDASASFQPAELGDILSAKSYLEATGKEGESGAPLYAFSIGDLAFAFAPFEVFDTNAVAVKEASKYPMTFYASCSNDYQSYLPTPASFDWEQHYEVRVTRYPMGTAAVVENIFIDLLDKTFAAGGYTEQPKAEGYITPEFVPTTDGKEYLNLTPGDTTQCKEVANGFWLVILLDGTSPRNFLAIDEATAHKVLEQTTMKLVFNEQNVIVDVAQ